MPTIRYTTLGNPKYSDQCVPCNTILSDAVEEMLPLEKYPFVRVYKYATLIDARQCADLVTKDCSVVAVSNVVRATIYAESRREYFYTNAKPSARVCDLARYIVKTFLKKGEGLCHMYNPKSGRYASPLDVTLQVQYLHTAYFRVCLKPIHVSCMCDVLSRWPYRVTSVENVSKDIFKVKTAPEEKVRDYLVFVGTHKPIIVRNPSDTE